MVNKIFCHQDKRKYPKYDIFTWLKKDMKIHQLRVMFQTATVSCLRLFGWQILVTTGGFELQISEISSNPSVVLLIRLTYYVLWRNGLGSYFVCKRFTVQTFLWSLEFAIQIHLEHDTVTICFIILIFT